MSVHAPCSTQVNQHSPVTYLVERQCLVECYLHGHRIQALWDTGSQVCIIDELWKQEYLLEVPLRDVYDLLESSNTLNLVAANGIDMPYIGYVEVTFRHRHNTRLNLLLPDPSCYSQQGAKISYPIIGFNVIEQIANWPGYQSCIQMQTVWNKTKSEAAQNIQPKNKMPVLSGEKT